MCYDDVTQFRALSFAYRQATILECDGWGVGYRDDKSDLVIDYVFATKLEANKKADDIKYQIRHAGWHVDPPLVFPVEYIGK